MNESNKPDEKKKDDVNDLDPDNLFKDEFNDLEDDFNK